MPPPPPSIGPPPIGKLPPKASGGRKDLLGSIEGFKKGKLKATKTNDKSSPLTSKISNSSSPSTSSSNNSSISSGFPQMSGGLFAGGMPKLRKTGLKGASSCIPTISDNNDKNISNSSSNSIKSSSLSKNINSSIPSIPSSPSLSSTTKKSIPNIPTQPKRPSTPPPASFLNDSINKSNISNNLPPILNSPSSIPNKLPPIPNTPSNLPPLPSNPSNEFIPPSKPIPSPSILPKLPLVPQQTSAIIPEKPLSIPSLDNFIDVSTPLPPAPNTSISSNNNDIMYIFLYNFKAEKKTDLSANTGDVILFVNKQPNDNINSKWWYGTNHRTNLHGLFPYNYVKELSFIETVYGIRAYQPHRREEMIICNGDEINVFFKTKGWWFGICGNKKGYFPINCITKVKPSEKKGLTSSSSPLYHSHSRGNNRPLPSSTPAIPQREAKVLYSFTAQHEGDLSIIKGQTIKIIKAKGAWWTGELEGNKGKIPANYVQLLE